MGLTKVTYAMIEGAVVNVLDYGAVGDGTTDDTAAIQAALDTSNVSVYIPEGTYVVSSLTIDGKKIYGSGELKWKDNSSSSMLSLENDGCAIYGITFDGNGVNQSSSVVMIVTVAATNLVIQDCTFKNGKYKGIVTDVAASTNIKFLDNAIYDWGTVANCDFVSFRSPEFIASNNSFTNIGNGHSIRVGLFSGDATTTAVYGGVVSGNTFEDTEHVCVTGEIYTRQLSITGNTFNNVEQGVKLENAGSTVYDISITGNTFINLTVSTANNLQADYVTFVGNTLRDVAGGCLLGNYAVCSNNTFYNCGTLADTTAAISKSSSFVGAIISGNILINSPYRAIEPGQGATVSDNFISNSADRSIGLGGTNCRVVNNYVFGGTYGIYGSSGATNLTMLGNRCEGASTANYSLSSTSGLYADASNINYSGVGFTKTIASGAITAPNLSPALVTVDTEGAAATDDLDTITGGSINQVLTLRSTSAARVITVKDGTDLKLAGDFVMNTNQDTITLICLGSTWAELARSDNA